MQKTSMQIVLDKRRELIDMLRTTNISVLTDQRRIKYMIDTINMIFDDIKRLDSSENVEEYIKKNKTINELIGRARGTISTIIDICLLNNIDRFINEFVEKLTLYLHNWNNVYNSKQLGESIRALQNLAQTMKTVPEMLFQMQQIGRRVDRVLKEREMQNPLYYKAAGHYLESIKKTFNRKKEKEDKLEQIKNESGSGFKKTEEKPEKIKEECPL